jgi:hypothetical protein
MKKLFVLLCAVAVSFDAAALTSPLTWRWSNPGPHGNTIYDLAYSGGLTVQVCERGQIYTSEDLDIWVPRDSGTTNSLRGVAFLGSRILVSGAYGTMLYADDPADFHVVTLPTTDWLEGVAASAALAVAVGDNASIYTSSDGVAWARQAQPFTNWLHGVAFGRSLSGASTFAVVGDRGFIATSSNGRTWQQRNSGTTEILNRVTWVGDRFMAAGENGRALVSNGDGSVWQSLNTGATNALYAAAGFFDSQLVSGDEDLRLRTNTLSSTWLNELTNGAPVWTYNTAVWENGLFLLCGRNGMTVEGYRTNSTRYAWVENSESIRNWLWDVIRVPPFYVTVGDHGTIMTSSDGIRWFLEVLTPASTNYPIDLASLVLLGVGGTTNGLAAVGNAGSIFFSPNIVSNVVTTEYVVTNGRTNIVRTTNQVSTIGVLWKAIEPRATTNDLQGVTLFNNTLIVSGGRGTILTSPNGTNWTARATPTTNFLSSVETFPGGVVAVGDRGTILTSVNGTNWTARMSGTTNWLYRVTYAGGLLVAAGQNGTILTSTDGVTWTRQTSGTTRWLNAVEYVDGTYFAVGTQGVLLSSSNAVDWSVVSLPTPKSLYAAASHNGQLVLAGVEGSILRSQVTPVLTPVNIQSFSRVVASNIVEQAFLFVGQPDQRFTLDRAAGFTNWSSRSLELLNGSATLLYLESGNTNDSQQFFRTTLEW